jgi:SET domain-containing protein
MPHKSSVRRPFRVGRSRTGFGLFATETIRRKSFIAFYRGRKLRSHVADELTNKYLFEINSRWTIDGSSRRNLARYINHSCRPNAEAEVKGHKIIISAMRTIHPGDEITYNYGRNYFNAYIKDKGCLCRHCCDKRKAERAARRAGPRRTQRKARVSRTATRAAKRPKRAP